MKEEFLWWEYFESFCFFHIIVSLKLNHTFKVGGSIPGKLTLLEALGKESDSDEDVSSRSTEENFMDLEKMACTLCKRQFPSYEVLQK